MARRQRHLSDGIALAISCAAHALLLVAIWGRSAPVGVGAERVTVILLDGPAASRVRTERPAPAAVPHAPSGLTARPHPPAGAAGARPATSPPSRPPEAGSTSPRVSSGEANGGGRPLVPARPDLRFSPDVALRSTLPDGDAEGAAARPEGEVVRERVGAILGELRGAYRATVPDAYWSPVRDRMSTRFVPSWSIFDTGRGAAGAARGLATVLSGYLDAARRYGRGGGVAGPREGADAALEPAADDAGGNPFHRELVVLVRVDQRLDGSVASVEVARSSGYRDLDRSAREAARAALDEAPLGPTPPQGRRTLWAFIARFEVVPPVPALGCPLDAIWTAELGRCAWPLKRSVSARIELRGVE